MPPFFMKTSKSAISEEEALHQVSPVSVERAANRVKVTIFCRPGLVIGRGGAKSNLRKS